MSALDKLFPSSFRKIPFLWQNSSSTVGGRKTVTHEFVNSTHRVTEDLGPLLKTYTLTGIVYGEDYLDQKDALIIALDKPGIGILVHPTFGEVKVVAKPYTVIETDTEIGKATFQLVFEKSEETVLPQPTTSSEASVTKKSDDLNKELETDTAENYKITDSKPSAFKSALQNVNSYINKIDSITEFLSGPAQAVAEFSSTVQNLQSSVTTLLSTPAALANAIKGLNDQMDSLFDVPNDQITALKNMFGYQSSSADLQDDITTSSGGSKEQSVASENISGGVDPIAITLAEVDGLGNSITDEEAELISNEKILTRQIRITALSKAYAAASLIEFENIEELDDIANTLETEFQLLYQDEDIPINIREALLDLRNAFELLLNEQRLSTKKVSEISIKQRPIQVLSYDLYGDSTLDEKLITLNGFVDVSHVSGDIKVLTQ